MKQGNATSDFPVIENLVWSTFYGVGSLYNGFFTVESNSSNDIWISGKTSSPEFPVFGGAGLIYSGYSDAVLLKFKNNGERNWAVFYGGKNGEYYSESSSRKVGIAVDDLGNSYITGSIKSDMIPFYATQNAYIDSINDCDELFIAGFDQTGWLIWGTYFGNVES